MGSTVEYFYHFEDKLVKIVKCVNLRGLRHALSDVNRDFPGSPFQIRCSISSSVDNLSNVEVTSSSTIDIPKEATVISFYHSLEVTVHRGKNDTQMVLYESRKGYESFYKKLFEKVGKGEDECLFVIDSPDGPIVSATNFLKGKYVLHLFEQPIRGCYSSLCMEAVKKRASTKRKLESDILVWDHDFEERLFKNSSEDYQGLDNLCHYANAVKSYYTARSRAAWDREVEHLHQTLIRVSNNIEPSTSYLEMPRRMIVDPFLYCTMNFVGEAKLKKYFKFACEKWLYEGGKSGAPNTTLGWGPRDYTVSQFVILKAVDEDASHDVVNADELAANTTSESLQDNVSGQKVSLQDNHELLQEMKQTVKFDTKALAQTLGEVIICFANYICH